MLDMRCDVCNRPGDEYKAIGVACTSVPYSCAFCVECATRRADPLLVFEHWFDVIGAPEHLSFPDDATSFFEGRYITYREWYAIRDKQQDGHVILWHYEQISREEPL
jgi:hypothetical protein